jgi:GNAT superfamily N-acetyltransferase
MTDIVVREMRPEDKAVWRDMRAALYGEDPSLLGDVEGYFVGDPMIARAFIAEDGQPRANPAKVEDFGDKDLLQHCHGANPLRRSDSTSPGCALGFVELSLRNYAEGCSTSPVPYVEGLYVAAGARRRNIGRLLMTAAEDWARANGFTEIASDTQIENEASLGAHQAYGFTEVERIICLRKTLG